MQNEDYQGSLEEAVRTLHRAETEIFTAMVNVGFQGVYKDISLLHENGEVLNLELAMFEDTEDANLEALVEAVRQIALAKQTLINLGNLNVEFDDE